jgi:glycosyltransferase involved in cell wall biosynthesis
MNAFGDQRYRRLDPSRSRVVPGRCDDDRPRTRSEGKIVSAEATRDVPSLAPDVSVVVPVYNPGSFIEPCIRGLLSQTLGASRCQLIFVDDGSTDETPTRLDALARDHPNVIVRHEPNSGWPGRPRNVGIDLASGEYIFFCDHDDWLEPDGLETLVRTARRADADIVIGKMVGRGRKVPVELFRTSRDRASVFDSDVIWALTPHKLFRRSFLLDHGLRFPEGKRRLEDHTFVTGAYFAARSIAIVADRPIYHHIRRGDARNAGYSGFDPVGYYRYTREAMDIVARHTEPGELRDRLMWRFLRGQMLQRLSEPIVLHTGDDELRVVFREIRALLLERYPASSLDRLRPVPRARARAIRGDRLDVVREIAQRAAAVVVSGEVAAINVGGGTWQLQVDASLAQRSGDPVYLVSTQEGWRVPQLIPDTMGDRSSTTEEIISSARARVTLRERSSWEEWIVPASVVPKLVAVADASDARHTLSMEVIATLDPRTVAGGRALPSGRWDVWLGLTGVGLARNSRLGPSPDIVLPMPLIYGQPPVIARLYVPAQGSTLRLEVTTTARRVAVLIKQGLSSPIVASRDRIRVSIPLATSADAGSLRCWIELRAPGRPGRRRYKAVIRPTQQGRARLLADFPPTNRPRAGRCELWLAFGKKDPMSLVAEVDVRRDSARTVMRRFRSRSR